MNPLLGLLLRIPLHGLGLAAALLPRRAELALGRALGRVFLALDRRRREIGRENMRRCLPELAPAEVDRLLRANYEHYGVLFLEFLHMFTPWPGHWRAYSERNAFADGMEHWRRAAARGKGVIIVGGHYANWELGCAASGIAGVRGLMVTRRLKPAWLHDWLERARVSTGMSCVYQPRTLPAIIKHLRGGGSVGFVLDQYMPPPMGEPMRFFGARVHTLAAVAPLARRTGAAVVPADNVRLPDGRVRVRFGPELPLSEDDAADNQRFVDRVEADIRSNPEQWLWIHRRFKDAIWPERTGRKSQAA